MNSKINMWLKKVFIALCTLLSIAAIGHIIISKLEGKDLLGMILLIFSNSIVSVGMIVSIINEKKTSIDHYE